MNRLKFVVFAFLALVIISCGKSKKSILVKEWKTVSLELAGNKLPADIVSGKLLIKEDGSFSKTEEGKTQEGKWALSEDETKLTFTFSADNRVAEKVIKEITETTLVLEGEEYTMNRLETFSAVTQ
jgi:hypothetical protein